MNLYLIKHEMKWLMNSKKNILFIAFLFILLCSYVFIILPATETTETFDIDEKSYKVEDIRHSMDFREKNRFTGFSSMTQRSYFADISYYLSLQSKMLRAFEEGDYWRYIILREHYLYSGKYWENLSDESKLFEDSPFPYKDRAHYFDKKQLFYEHLIKDDVSVTLHMIEGKTALQTLQHALTNFVIYLIIFCAIYFSNNILVRDRENISVLQGVPINWYRFINTKTIAAFVYTTVVLIIFMLLATLLLSMTSGFGTWSFKVPIMTGLNEEHFYYEYDMMPIATFLIIAFVFTSILIYLFTRLNMIFSLLFKNEWVVLFMSSLILLSETYYFARDKRELFGFDLSYFPQTYFDFGKVITGDKNFLVNLETITYTKGILVLLMTLILIEIILFLLSRLINRRRFYHI